MQVQATPVAQVPRAPTISREASAARLYYLDWLRVLAIFGVFLFHAVHPFDLTIGTSRTPS